MESTAALAGRIGGINKAINVATKANKSTTHLEQQRDKVLEQMSKIKASRDTAKKAGGGKKRTERSEDDLFNSDANTDTNANITTKAKKARTTLLGEYHGSLDFKANHAAGAKFPASIAITASEKVSLPVMLQFDDGQQASLIITDDLELATRTFWRAVQKKLEDWTPYVSDKDFKMPREDDKRELAVFADLMPGLLNQHGKLAYEKGNDRIPKKDYKAHLEGVLKRVRELLATCKNEAIDQKEPMTRQRLATMLQVPEVGTQMLTSQEHVDIMRAVANFHEVSVDTVRRELVAYGAVISNMANVTLRHRVEISGVAKCLIKMIQPIIVTFTEDGDGIDKYATADNNETSATNPDASASTNVIASNDGTSATAENLPKAVDLALVKFLGAHKCMCQGCDPEYHKDLQAGIMKEARSLYEASMTDEVKQGLMEQIVQNCTEEIYSDANSAGRQQYEREVLMRVKKECKEELAKQVSDEWKLAESERIRKEMRDEYSQKAKRAMMGSMD